MIRKFSILFLCVLFFVLQSCYTITHPDPCPGLAKQAMDSQGEILVKSID